MAKPITMQNLSELKKTHPGVYEDLLKLQQSHNNLVKEVAALQAKK